MKKNLGSSSKSSMKYPTQKGHEERNKKVPTHRSAAGFMSSGVTPKKGKGEF